MSTRSASLFGSARDALSNSYSFRRSRKKNTEEKNYTAGFWDRHQGVYIHNALLTARNTNLSRQEEKNSVRRRAGSPSYAVLVVPTRNFSVRPRETDAPPTKNKQNLKSLLCGFVDFTTGSCLLWDEGCIFDFVSFSSKTRESA